MSKHDALKQELLAEIQKAIEATPFPYQVWLGDNLELSGREPSEEQLAHATLLRKFFEDTWVGPTADLLFRDVAMSAALAATRVFNKHLTGGQ